MPRKKIYSDFGHITGYNVIYFVLYLALLLHVRSNHLTISFSYLRALPRGHFQCFEYHSTTAKIHLQSVNLETGRLPLPILRDHILHTKGGKKYELRKVVGIFVPLLYEFPVHHTIFVFCEILPVVAIKKGPFSFILVTSFTSFIKV